MPDTPSTDQNPNQTPPSGDQHQAEKYISQLVQLINVDKLDVEHTNLAKLDPSALQDHYRLELQEYQVEISHSKYPNSGKDSYVILFTNLKHVAAGSVEKIILAYMHLDNTQFSRFRDSALQQIDRKRRAEEEKRLKAALAPIDQAFEHLTTFKSESSVVEENPISNGKSLHNGIDPFTSAAQA